jgi:predicted dehydrogenase
MIGAGWIARRHVPAIDAADSTELVAVCDVDSSRAETIAAPRDARAYRDWHDMLDRERLDALWVLTPPLLHRGPTVVALERGIHVYLEKPIARTLGDGEAIVAAAAASEAICAVGYHWHATELLDRVRDATADQSIGMLVSRNYGPAAARPWFVDRSKGGGQVLERGSHHIDLQRAIAGEIVAVAAVGGSVALTGTRSGGDIEDIVTLTFHFDGGALGTVNIAWTRDGHPGLYSLDVLADDASIWLELGPNFRLRGLARGVELGGEYGDPFARSVARFLEAAHARDRRRVFCTPDDAVRTLAVALACERALASGETVPVTR